MLPPRLLRRCLLCLPSSARGLVLRLRVPAGLVPERGLALLDEAL